MDAEICHTNLVGFPGHVLLLRFTFAGNILQVPCDIVEHNRNSSHRCFCFLYLRHGFLLIITGRHCFRSMVRLGWCALLLWNRPGDHTRFLTGRVWIHFRLRFRLGGRRGVGRSVIELWLALFAATVPLGQQRSDVNAQLAPTVNRPKFALMAEHGFELVPARV